MTANAGTKFIFKHYNKIFYKTNYWKIKFSHKVVI